MTGGREVVVYHRVTVWAVSVFAADGPPPGPHTGALAAGTLPLPEAAPAPRLGALSRPGLLGLIALLTITGGAALARLPRRPPRRSLPAPAVPTPSLPAPAARDAA